MKRHVFILLIITSVVLLSTGCTNTTHTATTATRTTVPATPSDTPSNEPTPLTVPSSVPLVTCAVGNGGKQWQLPLHRVAMPAFDGGGADSGNMTAETLITTQSASHLACLWHAQLPGVIDGTFIEQPKVNLVTGTRDLLFATTMSGTTFALDSQTGQIVWQKSYPAGSCLINNTPGVACITTSSPALDPSGHYVYGYGLDGAVHKLATDTGTEAIGQGWPATVTLKAFDEKVSSALNVANGYVYVANGGYRGDGGDYQGHVTAINLATGHATVFNTLCSDQAVLFHETPDTPDCPAVQSAVWGRPGVTVDPVTGNVFFSTGNGDFNPAAHDWGDSVLMLPRDLAAAGGRPLDTYTPAIQELLNHSDRDLGSATPAILPQQAGSKTPWLLVQSGKDSRLRLINRQNLSGASGPGNLGGEVATVPLPQQGDVLTQPAVWQDAAGNTWLFVASYSQGAFCCEGTSAMRVETDNDGHTTLTTVYQLNKGGTSPVVAGGVLFVQNSGALLAFNATTGSLLWGAALGNVHWQSPFVSNGEVVVSDGSGQAQAFALPG